MSDKVLHTVQLAMVLITAILLIIFAHGYLAPDLIFTSLVAGVGGIVGTRIAANGYVNAPPAGPTTMLTVSQPAPVISTQPIAAQPPKEL